MKDDKVIIVKRPGIGRLGLAAAGAYWLAGIVNAGFIWVGGLIILLMLVFYIEDLQQSADETSNLGMTKMPIDKV